MLKVPEQHYKTVTWPMIGAISVVVTVRNEADSIADLLTGLAEQTLAADEIILVDGGSSDATVQVAEQTAQQLLLPVKIVQKKSNRSEGRNAGIAAATSPWIAITDGGCRPHPQWLEKLAEAVLDNPGTEVVAGYYQVATQASPFQQAAAPYFLVMPGRVNPHYFLPATRSMLLSTTVWQQLGGFPEQYLVSEDYWFAQQLHAQHIPISFTAQAVVDWQPPANGMAFAKAVFQQAYWDTKAGITRPKAWLVITRYVLWATILIWLAAFVPNLVPMWMFVTAVCYLGWAMAKNARYLNRGWWRLALLQLVADGAVTIGTLQGLISRESAG